MDAFALHQRKREKLIRELADARARGFNVGIRKSTSNLFRHRDQTGTRKIDVRGFNRVLEVDPRRRIAIVEGMTTYQALVHETLRYGLLPTVVPQLKTITVGGAVSGLGIESSSFRFGLVHEAVDEMEILLGDGRVIVCSDHGHSDLFYGFPNSYGTLGYALRLNVQLIPAKRYVHLTHRRFSEPDRYFAKIVEDCERKPLDYLDGTVFAGNEMYLTGGTFCNDAPYLSDYTYRHIYYKSIASRQEDWLTTAAYIWRWDTDWFWCSSHFQAQRPAVRLLATKWMLNSRTYQRIMRLSHRLSPTPDGTESVIQDVDIPVENASRFLEFLLSEIGITPVWICPFRSCHPQVAYDLYALDPNRLYINFGFWDTVATTHADGYFNRKVEAKALELEGRKALYSTAYYDQAAFWKIHNQRRYDELKAKYDAGGAFGDLYAKCVQRR